MGVFAIREIPPGTNLFPNDPGGLRELDPIFLENEDPEIRQLYQDFCVLSQGRWFGPSDFNNLTVGWYLNHSLNPNVAVDDAFNFVTLRDIRKGEELTVDYRTYSRELET
ncbi:MAG: SET domain-containing protein [Alphaproteobacteria bacterium]|nr:SET domain-containing protein [Alphaproteobacteria bacterium]